MIVQGKVHSVETYPSGTTIQEDYAAGVSVLQVGNVLDLQETDGTVTIMGAQYDYTLDAENAVMTLLTPLAAAVEAGEEALVFPASEEKRVYAIVDDQEDAVIATLPHALQAELEEGIREEGERESVLLEEIRGEWMVNNIVALDPLSDALTRQALSDAAAALVAAAAAEGSASAALTAANGKNSIYHATEVYPTTEANNAGDVWFVHEAGTGNIIAQYQGLGGTSWTPTQMSHQVIASVDLGKATVGLLAANYIDTGVLAAALTLTGYLIAGNPTGARVVLDTDGIRQYDDSGNIVVNIPTDPTIPSTFEGAMLANSLTVKDQFSLQGLVNEIARGSVLTVSGGTGSPTSAPSAVVGYQQHDANRWSYLYAPAGVLATVDDTPADYQGVLTFFGFGSFFGRSNTTYSFPSYPDSNGDTRCTYGNFGGATLVWSNTNNAERMITHGMYTASSGAVVDGRVAAWDLSPMLTNGSVPPVLKAWRQTSPDNFTPYYWRLGRSFSPVGSSTRRNEFAAILVGYDSDVPGFNAAKVGLRRYTMDDSTTVLNSVITTITIANPMAAGDECIGVTFGSSAKMNYPGANQDIWLIHTKTKTYAYNAAATARLPDFDFPTPAGAWKMYAYGDTATNGFIGFRSTEFKEDSNITKLTENVWVSPTSSKWWISTTNYDSDSGGTGLHESMQGPRLAITMQKRAGLVITVPPYPARPTPTTQDDPLASRVYIGRGTTDPGRTYMERAGTLNSPNRTLTIGTFTFPASTAANPPPASSNFPLSAPGKIQSADGTSWILSGDGKATFAGVEFDGAMPGIKSAAMRPLSAISGASFSTMSTTHVNYLDGPEVVFTAPPSGCVLIGGKTIGRTATDSIICEINVEVRTGSSRTGGSVVASSQLLENRNAEWVRAGGLTLFTGLTPGSTYIAHPTIRSGSSSVNASVSNTTIIVIPTL